MPPLPRVVIIGGGFGGLQCAKALRGEPVDVVLVDRRNYHLFTPLLYQVASCLLNPSEIAAPLRKVFRGAPNIRYREGDVVRIDFATKTVHLADGVELTYDFLVIATGSTTNYYGNASVEQHALGLKDLGEALQLRNHVLECLEAATTANDPDARRRLLTFCIVGGGPTGVEYAGALSELVRLVLPEEYPEIPPSEVRILLLEGGDRLLTMFVPKLSAYARSELEFRGVDVRTHTLVTAADDTSVTLSDGSHIPTTTMVWTAGVHANDIIDDSSKRITVDDHLRVPEADGVFAIGDVATAHDRRGNVLPMVSPPAMQAGRYVARAIVHRGDVGPFRYRDKGTLATIGRTSAVGQIGRLRFRGFIGWLVWLVVHLYYLIGFENRVRVMLRWAWYYVRLDRPVRVILQADPDPTPRE
ncbi:MAG TPA: NAD(P)/FAD-dependent oxidoreductase [Acidimicrobiia bacterium]|nr:NAD(P)/FAD-dependent oxidoreductase [Acidimicrobiia bacterium]